VIEQAPKLISAEIRGGRRNRIALDLDKDPQMQTQRQSLSRQVMGRIFNLFLRITLRLDFKDTQCGFKAFRRGAARALFAQQKIAGWGFDPELLFLARRSGFKVSEVPVLWAITRGRGSTLWRMTRAWCSRCFAFDGIPSPGNIARIRRPALRAP
jgi:hypothetical protein